MASVRTQIRKIAKRITLLYKKEIQRKQLIDTGDLQRSFETKIKIDRRLNLDIDVKCLDYFQYLDEPFDVSEDVFNSKEYKKIESDLIDIITDSMFLKVPSDFKAADSVSYNFKFKGIK
jgi:DNA-directed RNA polymerase beta' subunit